MKNKGLASFTDSVQNDSNSTVHKRKMLEFPAVVFCLLLEANFHLICFVLPRIEKDCLLVPSTAGEESKQGPEMWAE